MGKAKKITKQQPAIQKQQGTQRTLNNNNPEAKIKISNDHLMI